MSEAKSETTRTRNYTMTDGGWIGAGDAVRWTFTAEEAEQMAEVGLTRQEQIRDYLAESVKECMEESKVTFFKRLAKEGPAMKEQIQKAQLRANALKALAAIYGEEKAEEVLSAQEAAL